MKYVSRRLFLAAALYLVIILGIFAIQFRNGDSFSVTFGSLHITGTTSTLDNGSVVPVLPLHMGANGLDFFLDDQSPLHAYIRQNDSIPLQVTGFSQSPSSFSVLFEQDVSLSFSLEKRGDVEAVLITARIPTKYQKISLPYKITRRSHLENREAQVVVVSDKKTFSFVSSVPQDIAMNRTNRLIIDRRAPVVAYQTWIPSKGLVIEQLASLAGASDSAVQRSVEQFAANALVSFRNALSSGNLTEPLVAAYISEMGRSGMYRSALESIPLAWRNSPSRTWLTNTFLNNLEKTWTGFVSREREERSRLSRLLTDGNPEFFEFPSVIPFLVDRGSSVLLNDIARLAVSLDMASITPLQAAGILDAWIDARSYASDIVAPLEALGESCERRLKESLYQVRDQLYLSADGQLVDTVHTLRIAAIMRRYGGLGGDRIHWKAAGNLLANSLLSFGEERAEFPSHFSLARNAAGVIDGVVARTDRMIPPADLYPLVVSSNTWYPRALSLASSAGPGVWVWTSAQSVSVQSPASNVLRFTTRFPQGETHYMVFRGIKPFYRIQIYGMDFRTDPRFESYNSSGYRYNEETETLYMKMLHKAEYEDVTIWFGRPPEQNRPVPETSPAELPLRDQVDLPPAE